MKATAFKAAGFGLFAVAVLSGCTAVPAGEPAEQAAPPQRVSVPTVEAAPQAPQPGDAAPQAQQPQAPQAPRELPELKLSEQRAEGIALGHAKVSGKTPVYCKIDYEDDLPGLNPEWDCEFVVSDLEYNYEIDAVTGEIVNYERESVWD